MVQGLTTQGRHKVSPLVMHGLKWLVSKVNDSIVVTELCLKHQWGFLLAAIVLPKWLWVMLAGTVLVQPGTRLWNSPLWDERENASLRKLLCLKYCSAGNRKTRGCNSAVPCIRSSALQTQRERIYVRPRLNGDFGISSEKEWLLPSLGTKVFTLT